MMGKQIVLYGIICGFTKSFERKMIKADLKGNGLIANGKYVIIQH